MERAVPRKVDTVNHPPHYTEGKIEVIDFIEDQKLNYYRGNAVKYIARAGKKYPDPVEDLEKAVWYLQREIKNLKAPENRMGQVTEETVLLRG